jgi:DNA polymerase-3 subunit gamma/tau
VLATSGAIQLEHQFTGEKLIVPQSGEFFLNAGRLLPVAGTPGSCQCTASTPTPAHPPSPQYAVTVAPREAPESAPASAPVAAAPSPVAPPASAPVQVVTVAPLVTPQPVPVPAPAPVVAEATPEPETKPNIEISVLAKANEEHPIVPPAKDVAPAAPPSTPVYTAILPPLTFIPGSPARPPDPAVDVVLLIREAKVSPEWEFSGHVAAPEFAQAMQSALGEKPATTEAPSPAGSPGDDQAAAKPAKKKSGFWASLKHAFGGSTQD